MHGNLQFGWSAILLGLLVGAGIGIFFHDENWLGGYASRRRRMLRLGHIALVGTGLLNVALALSAGYLEIREGLHFPSILMIVGSATMPAVCFLSVWREPFRHLFFVPVLSLVGAVVLFLRAAS
jgi:hypothetical protein